MGDFALLFQRSFHPSACRKSLFAVVRTYPVAMCRTGSRRGPERGNVSYLSRASVCCGSAAGVLPGRGGDLHQPGEDNATAADPLEQHAQALRPGQLAVGLRAIPPRGACFMHRESAVCEYCGDVWRRSSPLVCRLSAFWVCLPQASWQGCGSDSVCGPHAAPVLAAFPWFR